MLIKEHHHTLWKKKQHHNQICFSKLLSTKKTEEMQMV